MMAKTSCGGTTRVAAAITWANRGLPPTSCSTFGSCDLRRVPLPAAMIAMATRGVDKVGPEELGSLLDLFICPNIPWRVTLQKATGVVTDQLDNFGNAE